MLSLGLDFFYQICQMSNFIFSLPSFAALEHFFHFQHFIGFLENICNISIDFLPSNTLFCLFDFISSILCFILFCVVYTSFVVT